MLSKSTITMIFVGLIGIQIVLLFIANVIMYKHISDRIDTIEEHISGVRLNTNSALLHIKHHI